MRTYTKHRPVKILRSNRKSMSFAITPEGEIVFHAPLATTDEQIFRVLRENDDKIEIIYAEFLQRKEACREKAITDKELDELFDRALEELPSRARSYAKEMDVTVNRITIRNQKTKWGSCTADGNLNLNCLLMLCPKEVQDYVIVHELCHRKEMNHSSRFWQEVEKVMPDYAVWRDWLKEHGAELIERMLMPSD